MQMGVRGGVEDIYENVTTLNEEWMYELPFTSVKS